MVYIDYKTNKALDILNYICFNYESDLIEDLLIPVVYNNENVKDYLINLEDDIFPPKEDF